MKKILVLFSLLCVPNFCWALDDACTKPDEYTIDKRCYVTEAQKKTKPYNSTVCVLVGKFSCCTGTIVKHNDKLYMYTAKHCVIPNDKISMSKNSVSVLLQSGPVHDLYKNTVGDFYFTDIERNGGDNNDGDYAIYDVPKIVKDNLGNIEYVTISDKKRFGVGPITSDYDARVIGYGALKIMSNKEISDFKQKYINYLRKNPALRNIDITKDTSYGFRNDGINTENSRAKNFVTYLYDKETAYYYDIFEDNTKLKVSRCKYSSNGKMTNCQMWGGNSGGGIFDVNGNIMGIATRAAPVIGGSGHAGAENNMFEKDTLSIILLDRPIISNDVRPK